MPSGIHTECQPERCYAGRRYAEDCFVECHYDKRHHDIQLNDAQHNDVQLNDSQHNGLICCPQQK